MVVVPAGGFDMGTSHKDKTRRSDEAPQHKVTIRRPFAVGKFEVTRGQYAEFVKQTGHAAGEECKTFEGGKWSYKADRSYLNPGFTQDDQHPVVCVSFADAKEYTLWLSQKTGASYRLLSEAEWEYTARATTTSPYPFEGAAPDLCRYGNGSDLSLKKVFPKLTVNDCSDGYAYTAPVGTFAPNSFGVHDMIGNVWEWVEDCHHDIYLGAPTDGTAWIEGSTCVERVLRGGAWNSVPAFLRAAFRNRNRPAIRNYFFGFRVAREIE